MPSGFLFIVEIGSIPKNLFLLKYADEENG